MEICMSSMKTCIDQIFLECKTVGKRRERLCIVQQFQKTNHMKNGIQYLLQDHSLLKELFTQYRLSNDSQLRKALLQQISSTFSKHATAKESYLYPLFRDKLPNGTELYQASLKKNGMHRQMLQLIMNQSSSFDKDTNSDHMVQQWLHQLERHMKDDEMVLPTLNQKLSKQELEKLEDQIDLAKTRAMTQGFQTHPIVTDRVYPFASQSKPL